MLTSSVTELSSNLAEVLVDSNQELVPKASTLVAELTKTTRNSVFQEEFVNKKNISAVIAAAVRGNDVGGDDGPTRYEPSEHDTLMDNYILDMGKLVNNYLAFARHTVNEKVTLFKEALENSLNSHKYRDPEDFFNVTYYNLHDIFKGQLVSDEISGYSGKTRNYNKESINLKTIGDLEDEEFHSYFLSGHDESDLLITSWLGSTPSVREYILGDIEELTLSVIASIDYALANFLFYRNMYEDPNVNSGDTSVTLKRKAFENKEYFGNLLAASLNSYRNNLKTGRLLSPETNIQFSVLSEESFDVVVFEENFEKIVEAGCGIETIFGYLSSTDSSHSLTVDKLIAGKEEYISTWMRTRSLYTVYLNNRRLDTFKHLARVTFDNSMSDDNMSEAELEVMSGDNTFKENTFKLGHDYINGLTVDEIDNIDKISLHLVAGIKFRFSNAYDLLKRMDELLGLDDDLDPKEAALYSTIDYLLDYCLQQTELVQF